MNIPTATAATDLDVPTSLWDTITVSQIIIGLIAVAAILLGIVKVARMFTQVRNTLKPFDNFFRDWNGEDKRPGVDARPGVMQRLSGMESVMHDTPTRAEFIRLESRADKNAELIAVNTAAIVRLTPPGNTAS